MKRVLPFAFVAALLSSVEPAPAQTVKPSASPPDEVGDDPTFWSFQPTRDHTDKALATNRAGDDALLLERRDIIDFTLGLFGKKRKVDPPLPSGVIPLSLTFLPNVYARPDSGLALGAAVTAGFRTGAANTTTLSGAFATITYSTNGQLVALAKHVIFTKDNDWLFLGDVRYSDLSQLTYGLGSSTPTSAAANTKFRLARVREVAYKRLVGNFFLGVGYELDVHFDIEDDGPTFSPRVEYEGARTSTISSGLTTQVLIDLRDSSIRPTRGGYFEAGFHAFPRALGTSQPWQFFHYDGRLYLRPFGSPRQVLALWAYGTLSAGTGPYLDLPSIGWDMFNRTGRGYVQGRFRGTSELYGEVEMRADITNDGLLGAVAFVNGSSFATPSGGFNGFAPAVGAGIRMLLTKATSTNVCLDVAFGRESNGVYFNAAEAF